MQTVTRAPRGGTEYLCLGGRWRAPVLIAGALALALAGQPASASAYRDSASQSSAGDAQVAAARLRDNLSPELLQNFSLFLYVDKADSGAFAQHMYVFRKNAGGDLSLLYDWPVSTGREDLERDAHGRVETTITPSGFYELDPSRQYTDYTSYQWNEPMPYAMFFSWEQGGQKTGLAIHAATDSDAANLGSRASAGCIRLAPYNARILFDLIHSQYRAPAPKLAYRESTSFVSSDGLLLHEPDGSLQLADGYSVLILVDDYTGEERTSSLF